MTLRRSQDESLENTGEMTAMETARSAAESSSKNSEPKKKEEESISLFWRVFGGTILSIVALVSITLYNNMSSSINELRSEISREREARAELVKKEDFNNRVTAQYERMRGIDALKVELEGLKEKIINNATTLDSVKRDNAASTDAMKKDTASLVILKERVAAATTDLKTMRDEMTKLAGEVEKNKSSDLDRKTTRDMQYKQIDENLKELQKAIQDCREKLARLEGAKPATTTVKTPNDEK